MKSRVISFRNASGCISGFVQNPPERGTADSKLPGSQGLIAVILRKGMLDDFPGHFLQRQVSGGKAAEFVRLQMIKLPGAGQKLRRIGAGKTVKRQ